MILQKCPREQWHAGELYAVKRKREEVGGNIFNLVYTYLQISSLGNTQVYKIKCDFKQALGQLRTAFLEQSLQTTVDIKGKEPMQDMRQKNRELKAR